MFDPIRRLVGEASEAKDIRAFWAAAAEILGAWGGGARVTLTYQGLRDSGDVTAGPPAAAGRSVIARWADAEGRHVTVDLSGVPPAFSEAELTTVLELTARLAVMVGRRLNLEREGRLGTFLVELSRWLLAAPERDLMLRYTLQTIMVLLDAHGAYAAVREPGAEVLRVVSALGMAAEMTGLDLPLQASVTGRVVRTGQPVLSDHILEEPDVHLPSDPSRAGRSAMIAPLHTSAGVVGAIGVVRYARPGAPEPPPYTLAELNYCLAVAAHIAGGLELATAVATTRAAAERAAAMVNNSPLPLAVVDPLGRVRQLNEAGQRLFGLVDEPSALGQTVQFLGLVTGEKPLAELLGRRAEADPWHGRAVVTRPDRTERACDCSITAMSGVGAEELLVALYDRTDELRAQRDLIAREKLATVGEIASGVAHEVNNPLTAIRIEAELLRRTTPDPEAGVAASTIVKEVDRAARIVRSLLRLARRADVTPGPVQLNELVHDVAEIRQRVLRGEGVELRAQLDDAAPPVLGLSQELQQVVFNLVTNAEHAVRGRGAAVIVLATRARPGWVELVVEDSGPGIAAAIRNRIFDPFFTTKGPDEGSGLGLAICQRVVTEVGGRISAEDSELGGAKFVVELPQAPGTL